MATIVIDLRAYLVIILAVAGYAHSGFCQGKAGDNRANPAHGKFNVTLVLEHKNASLAAISRKTATMIVWDTDRPVWTVTIPSRAPSQNESDRKSRLVQLAIPSGKELGSIPVGFNPTVRYFPNEERVIFTDDVTPGPVYVRIAKFGGETTTCLEGRSAIETRGLTPVSDQEAIGLREKRRIHTFVRLRTSDCTVIENLPADPSFPEMLFGGGVRNRPAVSPNQQIAAYIVRKRMGGPATLILRRWDSEHRLQRIQSPEGWLFWGLHFTPDSRQILVDCYRRDRSPGEAEAHHRVLVYDLTSGRLLRTMEIDGRHGLAVSPDGRLLAAGSSEREDLRFGGERVKAIAVLYDFESGQELARAEHPWFKWSRGMWGMLTGLAFSADGQYLVTSTNDVRVWRIESAQND